MPELRNIDVYGRTEWVTAEYVPDRDSTLSPGAEITFCRSYTKVGGMWVPPVVELHSINWDPGEVEIGATLRLENSHDRRFQEVQEFLNNGGA